MILVYRILILFIVLTIYPQFISAKPSILKVVSVKSDRPSDKTLTGFCAQMRKRLPRMDERACVQSQLQLTGASSVKGAPLWAYEMAQREDKNKPLRVLLVGGIHGDELTAPEIVLNWIARLSEADAARYHWKVMPLLNPDGFFAMNPQRTNANGVDLNRNFPTSDWANKAKYYWETQVKRDPRRYPGKAPLSEPESRWLHEQIESFKPHAIVSVHAPLGVLDFDGPAPAPRRIGRLYLDQVGVYPGSLGNYSGIQRGVPVVTLELPHSLNMPTAFEQDRMWRDMIAWLKQRSSLTDNKP
jgi:murein peptide amidase A